MIKGNPHLKPQEMPFSFVLPPLNCSPQTNHSDTNPNSDSRKILETVSLAHHGQHYLIGVILLCNFRRIHDLLFGRLMDVVLYYEDGPALCKDRNIISQSLSANVLCLVCYEVLKKWFEKWVELIARSKCHYCYIRSCVCWGGVDRMREWTVWLARGGFHTHEWQQTGKSKVSTFYFSHSAHKAVSKAK